eukprot:11295-Heterococcus_DN1.PRE.1
MHASTMIIISDYGSTGASDALILLHRGSPLLTCWSMCQVTWPLIGQRLRHFALCVLWFRLALELQLAYAYLKTVKLLYYTVVLFPHAELSSTQYTAIR